MDNPQRVLTDQELRETNEYRELNLRYKYYSDDFYMIYFILFITHAICVLGNYLLTPNPPIFLVFLNYVGFTVILIQLVFCVFVLKKDFNEDEQFTIQCVAFFFLSIQAVIFLIKLRFIDMPSSKRIYE